MASSSMTAGGAVAREPSAWGTQVVLFRRQRPPWKCQRGVSHQLSGTLREKWVMPGSEGSLCLFTVSAVRLSTGVPGWREPARRERVRLGWEMDSASQQVCGCPLIVGGLRFHKSMHHSHVVPSFKVSHSCVRRFPDASTLGDSAAALFGNDLVEGAGGD